MVKLYTDMVRVRKLDEKHIECLMAGKLVFFHSGIGQEAPGAAVGAALNDDDYLFYNHRSHGLNKALPKGISAKEILAEHLSKTTGSCGGFAGNHYCEKDLGILGAALVVGGEFTLAGGAALACKLRGKGQVVVNCFGDGSTGRGSFHEAMLLSATWQLPVIWLLENNLYQQWTRVSLTHPNENLADFATGYGMPSAVVDGQDALAVYEALQPAIERARAGEGPTLLEVKTYRYRGHNEGFPDHSVTVEGGVRPQTEIDEWKQRDPIKLLGEKLIKKRYLTKAGLDKIEKAATEEMNEAEKIAMESPLVNPEDISSMLYAS